LQEYFAIVEHLKTNADYTNDKIIINSSLFYALIDKNLYIKRKRKLEFYKALNLIICNSKGYTSVIYDKTSKKSTRKIIVNLKAYELLKKYYLVEIPM